MPNPSRLAPRLRVQADYVRAGVNRRSRIVFRSNAAADRERQEDLLGDRVDRAGECLATLERRGDVEHDDFVDALDVVAAGKRCRVASVAQLLKLHTFHDLAIADVHAGDDALGQHQAQTSRKLRRIVSPASPDFSGWNCTPKTLSRSTTDEKVLACVVAATHSAVTGAAYECVK